MSQPAFSASSMVSEVGNYASEKTTSINAMQAKLNLHEEALQGVESFDFNIFELSELLGREHLFSTIVFKIMNELPNNNQNVMINNDKLISFLTAIYQGYRRDVAYHNDLHGADVAQMMYLFIK